MRTLLVSGRDPVPSALREIVVAGSTSTDEVSATDLRTFISREGFGVDRVVFWAGRSDPDVRSVALSYAVTAGPERPKTVVFITAADESALDGLTREEMHVWPRDEEKLKMIFMTGG
jgi:hypothetical protein